MVESCGNQTCGGRTDGAGVRQDCRRRPNLIRAAAEVRAFWPRHRPDTALGWVCAGAAAASWLYAIVIGFALTNVHSASPFLGQLADWGAMPVQILACVLVAVLLGGRKVAPGPKRWAWWCVLAAAAGSLLATYVWNIFRVGGSKEVLTIADWIYLIDYWALTAAFGFFFVRAGGSFRFARVWLDAATMTTVQLVVLWSFFTAPSLASGAGRSISIGAVTAYSVTLTCTMTMAALLYLQLPSFRGRVAVLFLMAAGAADVVWEIMWMASWLTDRDFVGLLYNFGDVLCFSAVSSAVAAAQFRAPLPPAAVNPERRADSFLPALAVLVAMALVAGSIATARRWDGWILVGLVALCALLLVTRQRSVRKELRALHRQLATREADDRLTELVRRSADLIMVVDAEWNVSFASPATECMLGMSVEQVQHKRVTDLFGPDYSAPLVNFLQRVRSLPSIPSVMELRVQRAGKNLCVIKLSAVSQLANQLINGIVLTLTDVTEQRILEREVLDVAARERVRLSADIHDGLGQELVGISMLLHGAAASPDPDPVQQEAQLEAIVDHINRSVGTARDLARGLSPLHVVRGSLGGALHRLVPESTNPVAVRLDVDPIFDERVIDDFHADHLYRIAQEAVINAMRHSGCRHIDIALRRTDAAVVLVVADDGSGFAERAPGYAGLGLRLMEYRTRIVGGTLRVDNAKGSGTRVEVTMPLDAAVQGLAAEMMTRARPA